MPLITLLVYVLIFAVVVWAIRTIAAAFALPPQIQTVLTVIIVLIGVLWLASLLGVGGPVLRVR